MTILVPIVMFGWIPLVLLILMLLPPRQGVAAAFIAGWLFLPEAAYDIQGLPDYTKMSATCVGILIGTVLFHWDSFRNLRVQWPDLPMLIWCLVPLGSSLSNGLGAYDGVSRCLDTAVTWGFPYLIGRLHFNDAAGLRFLARALVIGGVVYVPFCLWEIKMSPQLNMLIYGFRIHPFFTTVRLGGYRPEVFMGSGLMVGMWMCISTLIAWWLWRTRTLTKLSDIPAAWLVVLLLVTAVLCKSSGALALLGLGFVVLWATVQFKTRALVYALAALPFFYCTVRGLDLWSGENLVSFIDGFNQDRAGSLRTRFVNEDRLVDRAAEQPLFGWGGFGRNRIYDEETGSDLSITDGLWVLTLGVNGLLGLGALLSLCALPGLLFVRRVPVTLWSSPEYAGAAVITVGLLLYAVDNLLNAMINPVFMLCAGGLASMHAQFRISATNASSTAAWKRREVVWVS